MRIIKPIKIKAALLVTVFSLNTVLGFACSIGLDMSYNKYHHEEEEVAKVSVHKHIDGKKHHHENEPKKSHHDEPEANHHDKKGSSEKDDCCTNDVLKFQQLDKNLAGKTGIDIPVFIAIIGIQFGIDILNEVQSSSPKYIASYFHPPPPDIRIAIQSFQI
ncbi:MAG: hypothetical protein ABIU11_01170 [Chitinophagaceae bacterium]